MPDYVFPSRNPTGVAQKLIGFGVSLLLLCAATQTSFSQAVLGRTSAAPDAAFVSHLERYSAGALDRYRGPHRRELGELYGSRDGMLLKQYADAAFLTDDYWQTWIDGLVARVAKANPGLVSRTQRAYVDRSASVNAHCFGNDVLTLNVGLVARASDEAQVAFVLCHELAHQALRHSEHATTEYIDRAYDPEVQREIRRARKDGLEGLRWYETMARDLAFDHSRHSRYGERAADSLGLVLFEASGFDGADALRAMTMLALANDSPYDGPLDLRRALSTPGHPSQESWFAEARSLGLRGAPMVTAEERDSLRTHPDTETRLLVLAKAVATSPEPTASTASDSFGDRREAAEREIIAGAFDGNRFDVALYYALRGVETDSASAWHRGMAALTLAYIADERKHGYFTTVVPLVGEQTDYEMRPLVEALHRMRGREIYNLAYEYAAAVPESLSTPESVLALRVASLLSDTRAEDASRAGARFRKTYPTHPYLKWDAMVSEETKEGE